MITNMFECGFLKDYIRSRDKAVNRIMKGYMRKIEGVDRTMNANIKVNGLDELCEKIKDLQDLIVDINNTDLEVVVSYESNAEESSKDRPNEKEKKFYLKHRWLEPESESYLNELTSYHYLYGKEERKEFKTKFTLKEIEEIKNKYDTDLKDFELIEVEKDA